MSWSEYAKHRRGHSYYQTVKRFILDHSPGDSILDVGAGGTDVVMTGEFSRRTAVNKQPMDVEYLGVNVLLGDWLEVHIAPHEVVTCCQVLEHIHDRDVLQFAEKLWNTTKNVLIISVPYMWPKGKCKFHRQDPISLVKLEWMMGAAPCRYITCTDRGVRRLVAEYRL